MFLFVSSFYLGGKELKKTYIEHFIDIFTEYGTKIMRMVHQWENKQPEIKFTHGADKFLNKKIAQLKVKEQFENNTIPEDKLAEVKNNIIKQLKSNNGVNHLDSLTDIMVSAPIRQFVLPTSDITLDVSSSLECPLIDHDEQVKLDDSSCISDQFEFQPESNNSVSYLS